MKFSILVLSLFALTLNAFADEAKLDPKLTELGSVKAYEWVIPPANEFCGETGTWITGAGGGPADTRTYVCDKTFNSQPTDVLADPSKAVLEYGSIEAIGNTKIDDTNYYATCTYNRRITAQRFSWGVTLKALTKNPIPLEQAQAVRNWLLSKDLFEKCKKLAPWATKETRVVINRVVP